MRTCFGLLFGVFLVLFATSGCGPHVTDEELGTVIYDANKLPGADQPYELPEQFYPPEGEGSSDEEEM